MHNCIRSYFLHFSDAMTSFVGGRQPQERSSSMWQKKYEGVRSKKFKPEIREKLIDNSASFGPAKKTERKRPSAFRMVKNFYDGYKDVSIRLAT